MESEQINLLSKICVLKNLYDSVYNNLGAKIIFENGFQLFLDCYYYFQNCV